MLSKEKKKKNSCEIAVKRRKAKSKGEQERYTHLNAEFQRIARRDKKSFLSDQWKEIEENNRMKKASGGDGMPVELIQILKEDAMQALHSICQQIWQTQQWPQDWKRSVFITIPKKFSSVQFSHSVMSDSLRPHESQHTRPPCPSPTPRVHSDSHPSSQ